MNETKPQIADDPAFSPSRRLSIAELSGHILRGLREQVKTMLSHDALCDGSKCGPVKRLKPHVEHAQ